MKNPLVGCGILMVIGLFLAGGICYFGYHQFRSLKSAHHQSTLRREKSKVMAIAQRREFLESKLDIAKKSQIPEEFYTYPGFRDWWRMPLVFPYQLSWVDTLDSGQLGRYDPGGSIEDPNGSISQVISDITRFAIDSSLMVAEIRAESTLKYILFDFKTGSLQAFDSEREVWTVAKWAGFTGRQTLLPNQFLYDRYYDLENRFDMISEDCD
ncbi:hypothetical protein JIN85_11145 [Luteolibacter pohnpeiensis]|uniref:Uncharacterized protein n=1 Tax=Luteolibacter pohnpeiensis TaxID=454153 RepID=A0A934S844_9BACT|nr:hypothetical protein [Luteolibacter pohnpeiensis]MBK1882974.1 hypothetical protein [Luteolibacter pohnpeiensis]